MKLIKRDQMGRVMFMILLTGVMHCMFTTGRCQSVDPMTGRAIVNIPLGSISAMDMSASVNLAYNGGALRVNEGPGNAGMGWNVAMGGAISREVRGLPDDINTATKHGWLSNGAGQSIQNFNSSTESADWTFLNSTLTNIQDPEPDIYYFQAPGIAGKFMFAPDGTIQLSPYQDLVISFSAGTFLIKTNTGTTYSFANPESVTRQAFQFTGTIPVNNYLTDYNYYQSAVSFNVTWRLSSIQSGSTGTTVWFNYAAGEQAMSNRFVTLIKPTYTTQVDTVYYLQDLVSPLLLNQISIKNYSINITWANSLVDKVTVNELESGEAKEYDLVYKTIHSTSDSKFSLIERPFLTQVKQQNSCIAFPSYLFGYEGVDTISNTVGVAWRRGWGEDHFGYNNGQGIDGIQSTSNRNIPTIYFYPSETGPRRLRVTPIPGLTPTLFPGVLNRDRNVNSTFVAFGALTGIAYPTGGYTNIQYEPNKYVDASTGEELLGPGIRVKSISTSGGETAFGKPSTSGGGKYHSLTKNYEYLSAGSSTTSGKILYPPVFAFTDGSSIMRSQTDLGPGAQVLYSRVKELTPGQGARVYLYDQPSMYPDASAPVSKVARASGSTYAVGQFQSGTYQSPFAPLTDLDFKRGFLTRISEYNEAGTLTQEKRMGYTLPQANTFLKGLRYEYVLDANSNPVFFYSQYQIPINQSRILLKDTVTQVGDASPSDLIKSITAYQYNTKNMLVQSTQTNDDNSVVVQNIKYALDYAITAPTSGDLQANAIFKLKAANRYAEVIESYQTFTPITGTATVTGAGLTLFKDSANFVLPYQQKQFPQTGSFTPAYNTTGATQSFVPDSKYILSSTTDFVNGFPVNQVGPSRILSGTIYSTGTGLPLASLANCKSENAVYEGFEFASTRGLSTVGGTTVVTTGWTGKNALQLSSATSLISTATTKRGSNYRLSCWINAPANTPANTSITIQALSGTTIQATATMLIAASNLSKWTYLEVPVNMTAVATAFTWKILNNAPANAAIIIDDFIAIPMAARITSKTYLPLTGVTSETDDRGNSNKISYDVIGRPVSTEDRKRNLVAVQEYGVQRQGVSALNANFSSNKTQYNSGEAVQFTAGATCLSGISYKWKFIHVSGDKDSVTTTAQSISYTFNKFGSYTVRLTASKTGYTNVVYSDNICVNPGSFATTISHTGSSTFVQCSDGIRDFTCLITGGPKLGWNLSYVWWIEINGVYVAAAGSSAVVSISGNTMRVQSPLASYHVKCIATAGVFASPMANFECILQQPVSTAIDQITFVSNPQCQ